MKKKMSRTLAVLMCLMTAVAFMPTFAFAEDGAAAEQENQPGVSQEETQIDSEETKTDSTEESSIESETENTVEPQGESGTETVEPAADADVYFTLFIGGSLAVEKGEIVYKKKITVSDENRDGELTYDEAAVALHKKYNRSSDFEINPVSGWVTKFWGFDGSSLMMMKNGKFFETVANNTQIKNGDQLVAGEIQDAEDNYWMNAVTAFNKTETAVAAGQDFRLKLSYGNNFEYDKNFNDNPGTAATSDDQDYIAFGIVTKDGFENLDASIDDDGFVTLNIKKEGTFLVSAMGFIGDAMLPIGIAPVCKVTVTKNAPDAEVTFTVSNKGVLAAAKDGSIMVNRSVTVKDIDTDGVLSFDEALVALHKRYCNGGEAAYVLTNYGTYTQVTKLWGEDTNNTLFFKNNEPISSGVDSANVQDGDKLLASVNLDNNNWADWFTAFNKDSVRVAVNEEFSLKLTGGQGMAYPFVSTNSVESVEIGTWENGKFKAIEDKKTDENGEVTLSFAKTGVYYVTASGTVEDDVVIDWNTNKTEKKDCPIIAPACKVTVYDDGSVALAEAKTEAIETLNGCYDISKYRSFVRLNVLSQVVAGVAEINTADTPEKVNTALGKAIEKIGAIKTDAQMTADENAVRAIGISSFSVKAGKKKATVNWKRNTTFSGYQIYYKQSGKKAKYTYASSTASSKTIKSLKKGKKYTFKVRGYKKMNGKTIYSNKWSSSKTVRIK